MVDFGQKWPSPGFPPKIAPLNSLVGHVRARRFKSISHCLCSSGALSTALLVYKKLQQGSPANLPVNYDRARCLRVGLGQNGQILFISVEQLSLNVADDSAKTLSVLENMGGFLDDCGLRFVQKCWRGQGCALLQVE